MADGQSRGPTPPGEPAGRPGLRILFTIVGSGLVMAVVGCLSFLNTMTGEHGRSGGRLDEAGVVVYAAFFVVGLLMFVLGIIGALLIGIVQLFRRSSS